MRRIEKRCCATALRRVLIMALAVGVAGCSQASRFDGPPWGPIATGSNRPADSLAPIGGGYQGRVEVQPLSPQAASPLPPAPADLSTYTPPHGEGATHAASPISHSEARDDQRRERTIRVTVNPGDTVDDIARRYGVRPSAVLRANHIAASASIRPGQQLLVPIASSESASGGATRIGTGALPRAGAAGSPLHPTAVSEAVAQGGSVHVVRAGETLSSIAHHVHRSRTALAKANNIDLDAKLKIGQQIAIPRGDASESKSGVGAGTVPAPQAMPPASQHGLSKVAFTGSAGTPGSASADNQKPPTIKVAAATAHVVSPSGDAGETALVASSQPKLRWPVHGRIICGFGCRANGQQNEGINVAVPEGTPIKAADDGVVAYAGNELKGYGNLVLVRHPNGLVTAYANASELSVKRGDQIKRGQVIGRSGQTGSVTSPQLHFEVRKGATPVDPTQYLSGT